MCIILLKPTNVNRDTITEETLANCWDNNPDGAGIMFAKRNELHTRKGFMRFGDFMDAWDRLPNQGAVIVAHFRIGTHGAKDHTMTHPFTVSPTLAMVHNGILPIEVPAGSKKSDTALFVDTVLKNLPAGWEDNKSVLHLIDGYIGGSNKLVFLANTGRTLIFNEKRGVWSNGCWFSNSGFERSSFRRSPPVLRGKWTTSSTGLMVPTPQDRLIPKPPSKTIEVDLDAAAEATNDEAAIRRLEDDVNRSTDD